MINKKQTKIMSKKAAASYLQIFLLIMASFAFSYLIRQSSSTIDNSIEKIKEINKEKQSLMDSLVETLAGFIINKLREPILPLASAEIYETFHCCEQGVDGGVCEDIVDSDKCQAGSRLVPIECEKTSFCKKGCCIDDIEGTYDRNVPEVLCKGRWEPDKNCNVPGASLGCCVLGLTTAFVTDTRCTRLSELTGVDKDYRPGLNELECVALSTSQEEGACVLEGASEKPCKFTTQQECIASSGAGSNFYIDVLCTDSGLNTGCEPTEKTLCVDGKDEVYFVDSCGNPANIYDAGKVGEVSYWENVVEKEDSCGADSANGNANSKSCGNCNRFYGGICSSAAADGFNPDYGDFYCKDTSCKYKGEEYRNGESWCVYDGHIGEGDDVVGSRHWKYVCNQGEIQVEPCADYRQEICVQATEFDTETGNVEFSNANCRINNWRACIMEEGNTELDCMSESVVMGDDFNFNKLVPEYPGGFGFDEGSQTAAKEVCAMASKSAKVVYARVGFPSKCECVYNCELETAAFTQKMNDACRKLGDCGAYVNYIGVGSDKGYSITGAPSISADQYKDKAEPVEGQYAEPGNMTQYLEAAGLIGAAGEDEGYEEGEAGSTWMKIGGGALGVAAAIGIFGMSQGGWAMAVAGEFSFLGQSGLAVSPVYAGFGNAMMGAGIGMMAASFYAQQMKISNKWVAGTIAILGAAAGYSITAALGYAPYIPYVCFDPVSCAITAIIIIITIITLGILGRGGVCKEIDVKFECKPWQPPVGGNDCNKCNEDPLKPCSEYRCKSLGAACELINPGTNQELCFDDNPNDATPPKANPNYGFISEGRQYSDITENGFKITSPEGECLNAYENLMFSVKTSEPAHCKFDLEQKEFEEMSQDLGTNAYTYDHTVSMILPDPSHGQSQGIDWTGDLTFYIKCQDTHGIVTPGFYTIDMCVKQGADNTPPLIASTEPANNLLISYGASEQDVEIYTAELAECKWSTEDKDYNLMENSMICNDTFGFPGYFSYYACSSTLPIGSTENKFYIRCEDQPWLEGTANESDRNANQQSYEYTLRKVENPISIDWIMPNGDFEVSFTPSTVVLKVQTAGGGEWPECSYSFTGYDNMIEFFKTYSSLHEQEFILNSGNHRIYIECSDETGDTIQGETNFKIIYDTSIPQVARVYVKSGSLKIITTEYADCRYSTEDCDFNFESADGAGTGKEHSINSIKGKTYYIKCKDEHGNVPAGCSIIVKAT